MRAIFLERKQVVIFYSSWKYLICFYFRLNNFKGMISILLLPLGGEDRESWYTYEFEVGSE